MSAEKRNRRIESRSCVGRKEQLYSTYEYITELEKNNLKVQRMLEECEIVGNED
jgi:hypothetical protein